ncbi:MAG TPA: transglycosylase SLT domain-containing protein [Gemmatimonadales bacterium]
MALLSTIPSRQPTERESAPPPPAVGETGAAPVSTSTPAFLPPPTLTPLDSSLAENRLTAWETRKPLQRYFARFSDDRVLVRRVAKAVALEAKRQNVPASLIAAVVVTENTTLTPAASSSVGALGLMQVMPMHAGRVGCQSDDLVEIESNICHGTRILSWNLRRTGSPVAALLRYNGCVKGTNTPDCRQYPVRVLARASRVREEILAAYPRSDPVAPAALPAAVQLARR